MQDCAKIGPELISAIMLPVTENSWNQEQTCCHCLFNHFNPQTHHIYLRLGCVWKLQILPYNAEHMCCLRSVCWYVCYYLLVLISKKKTNYCKAGEAYIQLRGNKGSVCFRLAVRLILHERTYTLSSLALFLPTYFCVCISPRAESCARMTCVHQTESIRYRAENSRFCLCQCRQSSPILWIQTQEIMKRGKSTNIYCRMRREAESVARVKLESHQ